MLFSQRFGYATHALAYIAKKPLGTLTTLPEVAGWLRSLWPEASETYLSNVIQRLARGGVLRSHRGIGGGYSLARPADRITLRDLAEVLEGVSVEQCGLSMGMSCSVASACRLRRTIRQIEEQFLQSLEQITLKEIAAGVTDRPPPPDTTATTSRRRSLPLTDA